MRHNNALRLLSMTLLVVVGTSCGGCGGDGNGELTPAQQYAQCLTINDPARQASCLITLSGKQEHLRDLAGAKKSRESAAAAAKNIRDASTHVDTFLKLADAYVAAGDREMAKKTYTSAEEVLEEVAVAGAKARFLVRLAKLKLDADKRDGAEFATSDLKAAEGMLEEIALAAEKIEVLALMTDGYGRLDDSEASQRIAELLVALPDSIDDWSAKVQALVAVAGAQRTALNDAAACLKTLDVAREIVEGVDYGSDKDLRLKVANRRYNVAEGYVNAGKSDPARNLLDVAHNLAMLDPQGADLADKINQLRGRL